MVGQERILNILSNYNLDDLPHSILLLGEKGSGKHTIADFLSSNFHLDIIDMTENIEILQIIFENMICSKHDSKIRQFDFHYYINYSNS